jgi:hypothetical protein
MKNDYVVIDNVLIIFLNNQSKSKIYECILDAENFDIVDGYNVKWFPKWQHTSENYHVCASFYLGTRNGKSISKPIYMARVLLNAQKGEWVDHIDHNPMNNRKSNLRKVTNSENLKNRHSKNINNTSGFRNVSFYNRKFLVQLQVDGKNRVLGRFDEIEEAGEFAELMRKKYYGEYSGAKF